MEDLIRNNPEAMKRIRLAESFPVKESKIIISYDKPWVETTGEESMENSEKKKSSHSDTNLSKGVATFTF